MPYLYYLEMRRDAYIHALRGSGEGRKYLENAYRLTQTSFDAGGMRGVFGAGKRPADKG